MTKVVYHIESIGLYRDNKADIVIVIEMTVEQYLYRYLYDEINKHSTILTQRLMTFFN